MTVDDLREWRPANIKAPARRYGTRWCHMMADGNDLDALHAMARTIGLSRSAFQGHSTVPHYDLTPNKRALAVCHGAVEVSGREQIRRAAPLLPMARLEEGDDGDE